MFQHRRFGLLGCLALAALTALPLHLAAEEPETQNDSSTPTVYRAPVIEVLGADERDMERIPGSGVVISPDKLDREQPISVQESLRGIPGVNLRSEDGIGLVPNIGIRGLNPDRSEKLLILEDGMPAGLAPYTENAAYYIPPIERMERVELLKGSGSILYGPQTVGGVLNLITPAVPEDYRSLVRVDGGTDAYLMGHGTFGKTWGPFGIDISLLHKQGDGFKDASAFNLNNFTGKMKFTPGEKTKIILKTNYHDQTSSQTYLGLTPMLFAQDPDFNPSPFDRLDVERFDTQFTLQHFFTEKIELLTNIYYWKAHRNWNRQDFARNTDFDPPPANTVATFGDTSLDGGAIFMRESFGSRDRQFEAAGIEPRLIWDYTAFGREHHLHTGVRFHWEEMIDERNNRSSLIADPVTRTRDVRMAYAFAFFFQNTLRVTDHLSIIPGFRLEQYEQTRDTQIADGMPTSAKGSSVNTVPLPGLGITYQFPGNTTLFTGIHRGFAPPRTAQAISSTGQDLDLQAEFSWNYELGARTNPWPWWRAEGTFFYMDFSNQVVPANESGGASTTDTNAGQTRHIGFEFASSLDMLGAVGVEGHQLFLDTNYTYVDAQNTTPNGPFNGNTLPYAPHNLALVGVRYNGQAGATEGLTFGMEGIYTSSQFADQANTVVPSNDGLVGEIPSYWVVNAYGRYQVPKTRLEVNLIVNNMLNNTYVVSRAPEGIFPGPGLQVLGGLKYDLF